LTIDFPFDGASRAEVELTWRTSIGRPTDLTSMDIDVYNRGTTTSTIDLSLVSFGLDFRTVRRTLDPIRLEPGQRGTRTIELSRELPIQSVSYSSDAFVEARLARVDQAPLVIDSQHVYNHYSSDYERLTVYDYDTMVEAF